jgi:hypothetical protein
MNNNLCIKNAFICQFKNGAFIPIFGDIIIEDELIHEIKETSYSDFLYKQVKRKILQSTTKIWQNMMPRAEWFFHHSQIFMNISIPD